MRGFPFKEPLQESKKPFRGYLIQVKSSRVQDSNSSRRLSGRGFRAWASSLSLWCEGLPVSRVLALHVVSG